MCFNMYFYRGTIVLNGALSLFNYALTCIKISDTDNNIEWKKLYFAAINQNTYNQNNAKKTEIIKKICETAWVTFLN